MPKKKSPNSVRLRNSTAEFLTFACQTGGDGVEVRVQDGTIWLSQKNIGLLFDTTPENVLMHLKNIYAENVLAETATANDFLAVQTEGKRQVQRTILHYNLDALATTLPRALPWAGIEYPFLVRTVAEEFSATAADGKNYTEKRNE